MKNILTKYLFFVIVYLSVRHSLVAQSVEQVAVNHPVGGSSPSGGAKVGRNTNLFCLYRLYKVI